MLLLLKSTKVCLFLRITVEKYHDRFLFMVGHYSLSYRQWIGIPAWAETQEVSPHPAEEGKAEQSCHSLKRKQLSFLLINHNSHTWAAAKASLGLFCLCQLICQGNFFNNTLNIDWLHLSECCSECSWQSWRLISSSGDQSPNPRRKERRGSGRFSRAGLALLTVGCWTLVLISLMLLCCCYCSCCRLCFSVVVMLVTDSRVYWCSQTEKKGINNRNNYAISFNKCSTKKQQAVFHNDFDILNLNH